MMNRFALLFIGYLIFVGGVMAETIHLEPAKLKALSDQREQLIPIIKELNESNSLLAALQTEFNVSQESMRILEIKSKEARDNLEKKQKYDRENPGEITDKLLQAQEQNRQASSALKEAKARLVEIEQRIIEKKKNLSTHNLQFKRLQQIFESDIDALVEKQLQISVEKLQVARQVEAKGQVSCGEDSMRVCKDSSKKEAERNAIEQGSVIDFSALTEVRNYKLTKEELKSEVHANLTDEKVIQQKIVDDSTGFTQIRVTVKPVIGEQLRKQIAGDIRADIYHMLGGPVDYVAEQSSEPGISNASQNQVEKQRRTPPVGKNLVRVGHVSAIKPQYGYLVIALDTPSAVASIEEVVIVKNGKQFYGIAEKRLGSNVSITLDEDDLRRIENYDAVFGLSPVRWTPS